MESSNLEVFLEAATPQLPWRSAPMECFQGPNNVWQLEKKDVVDYFSLEDLWEHYSESSAYGLAVPVRLENGKLITQHFVPYLSAIQIYTSKTLQLAAAVPSMGSDESSDSWSDDDSTAAEKLSRSWDAASSDDSSSDSVVPATTAKQGGYLNFQYTEWDPPYERIPLADKVAQLAQDYPYLTSLKSAQLSPSSWLSVAWYPIYHIPYHGNLKGTCACFLTYHSISSVFQDKIIVQECHSGISRRSVAVSPFGLATYRMHHQQQGKQQQQQQQQLIWTSSDSSSRLSADHLYGAASSWLKQVGAHHPDFNFFTSRNSRSITPPPAHHHIALL